MLVVRQNVKILGFHIGARVIDCRVCRQEFSAEGAVAKVLGCLGKRKQEVAIT